MKKLKLFIAALALLGGVNLANAQTDVTSTYITNADFEGKYTTPYNPNGDRDITQPDGWTLTYTNGVSYDSSILTKEQATYSNISSQVTIPGDGRGKQTYAVRFHNNGNKQLITLAQTNTFPKGKYTLSGLFRTQNQNEIEVGFYFGEYSNNTRVKYEKGNGAWNTLTTTFESTGEEKTFGVFFKHTSSNQMIAGVDNIQLMYENVDGQTLANLIEKATAVNSKLNSQTLADALSSAQTVYIGIDNTPDYQASIDQSITVLEDAINTTISNYSYDPSGDDVSVILLDNPGFDIDINFPASSSTTTATAANTVYTTFGWTPTVPGNCTGATIGYGFAGTINGSGNVTAPTSNADGTTTGGALVICVGWSGEVTYKSLSKTLPAGSYRITYRAYNGNTKNTSAIEAIPLVGFVPTIGDAQINSETETFTNQAWSTHTYSFTLEESTEGQIQIGLKPTSNTNSYNAPELFIDEIKLEYFNPLTLALIQWQEVHEALAALDATLLPDAAEEVITNELAKSVPTTSVEDVNNATAALQALVDSYDDIKAAYDKLKALITLATNEKENSIGSKNDIESAITTATSNKETRTTALDLENDYSTLEQARQTYVTGGALPTEDNRFDFTFKIKNAAVTSTDNWDNGRVSSNEQYTGAPDNTYLDNYNETRNIKQNIGRLNHGRYQLKVATRAISSLTVGNVYVLQNGANLNQEDVHKDGSSGGELENGWSWTYVNFENASDDDVVIGFYSECGSYKWAGADDFHLYYYGPANMTATVTSAGMATFCSPYPLDFTDKDVKAYTASLTGDEGEKTVLLTRVYQVPAETGLVLKGDEGSYNIPVIASAEAIEGNLMVGTLTVTNVDASTEGSYNYMLSSGDNNVVGFYNVALATTSAAGKAYLHTTEALKKENNANRVLLVFSEGNPTGIAEIGKAVNAEGKIVYNLSGQQVKTPTKGFYIINGKKVVIK